MADNEADGAPGRGEARSSPTDEALSARLRSLGERLDRVDTSRSSEPAPAARPGADSSAFANAMRLSSEFVAGIVVGAGLGWLLDRWLGTSPWGLILFLMVGFAAGVLNVLRASGESIGTSGREK
jgi:ATP synthase protein I